MYCIKCGKKLDDNHEGTICLECEEKENPKQEINNTENAPVKVKKKRKKTGLALGITSIIISLGAIVLTAGGYLMTTVASNLQNSAVEARHNAANHGVGVEGYGFSGFLVILFLIVGIILALLAIGGAFMALCFGAGGIKNAAVTLRNKGKAVGSLVINIIGTVISGSTFIGCLIYTIVVIILKVVVDFIRIYS